MPLRKRQSPGLATAFSSCALAFGAAACGVFVGFDGYALYPSSDTELVELSFSNAVLSPPFAPGVGGDYRASPISGPLLAGGPSTVVTARARSAEARVSVDGVEVISGVPTPLRLRYDQTKLDVVVTAASGESARTIITTAVKASTFVKASNTHASSSFGSAVALDGDTLVVGAAGERSNASGVNGDGDDRSLTSSGAAYVFVRTNGVWTQQAYVKASNPHVFAQFGVAVALSGDTMAVGADAEDSAATGIGGNGNDTSAPQSGAVYVFTRANGVWSQQAYLKASNSRPGAYFGRSVALTGDTLVVGAPYESSSARDVGGNAADASMSGAGAAYVFERVAGAWSQTAYLKASNTRALAHFGHSVTVTDGLVAVGSPGESSGATGVGGDPSGTSADRSGAVYLFARAAGAWTPHAYLKPSNTHAEMNFGYAVAASGDTIIASAPFEDSGSTSINAGQDDRSARNTGAAYVFRTQGGPWRQEAYLKAANARAEARFGSSVGVDGDVAVVGSLGENSGGRGVDGDPSATGNREVGAAYVFRREAGAWKQGAYLKPTTPKREAWFGSSAAIRAPFVAVGGPGDSSAATGLDGDEVDDSRPTAGAVHVF